MTTDASAERIVTAECGKCMRSEQARNSIASEASRAVQAVKSRDMKELSKLVHPVNGVRFSPHGFLDKKSDIRFTPAMLRVALADHGVRVWGTSDGSGKPIRLSFANYFKRFVYDRDFANAEARSNTHDNSREEYPDAIIVEFYIPGSAGTKAPRPAACGLSLNSIAALGTSFISFTMNGPFEDRLYPGPAPRSSKP